MPTVTDIMTSEVLTIRSSAKVWIWRTATISLFFLTVFLGLKRSSIFRGNLLEA